MPFLYTSGEEVRKGDRVTYCGEPGEIEAVADELVGDAEADWFVKEVGRGVLINEPKVFGHVFVHNTELDEDLILIAREDSK